MTTVKVCIRIDIDTVKDAQVLPPLLDMLDLFNMRATFFVTTGADTTYRNYRNYTNPLDLIKKRAILQHGVKQIFRGLLYKQHVEQVKEVKLIPERGHELGLHGHNHYDWMNTLHRRSRDEIAEWISKGCELFEKELGFLPGSFASPGFATSPAFLEALDDLNFEYSSDFRGTEAFYPASGEHTSSTLQLPVAERSFGELQYAGLDDDRIYRLFREGLDNAQDFFIFYMHPSYEPVLNRHLLTKVLEYIASNSRFETVTLSQLAKNIKRGDMAEDTANI
jgi:peptidoglycan/xylan/chitin deacetylase (PgdA/CDA1 family)